MRISDEENDTTTAVTWTSARTATAPINAEGCVGPIVLIAEQIKIFTRKHRNLVQIWADNPRLF
jgi:hypothetical protein